MFQGQAMFQRERIQPPGLSVRRLDGHTLYSHVISVSAARTIYISGQLSRDESGAIVGAGNMVKQIEQVGRNLEKCLHSAGATLADLVRTTTYVTDIDLFFRYPEVRAQIFGPSLAASTTVEVQRLSHPDFLIEIEGIAVLNC
jgi:2-iminobutanoate/2-iminopropanoate deaminase